VTSSATSPERAGRRPGTRQTLPALLLGTIGEPMPGAPTARGAYVAHPPASFIVFAGGKNETSDGYRHLTMRGMKRRGSAASLRPWPHGCTFPGDIASEV
jgi:hypothetical protein